jgi:alginate O-acetyltransferase complex protein AlgI
MLLGGLWHGAAWTFVIWGAIHGGWLAVERLVSGSETPEKRFGWPWRIVTLAVVGVAWVFFRASSVAEAFRLLGGIGNFGWRPEYGIAMAFLAVVSAVILLVDFDLERSGAEYVWGNRPLGYTLAAALALAIGVAYLGATDTNAFIYFQF